MTKINELTENSSLKDRNLFVIFDGARTVSIEASVIKSYIADKGFNPDAFVSGRLDAGKLYMKNYKGVEVLIGDTFNPYSFVSGFIRDSKLYMTNKKGTENLIGSLIVSQNFIVPYSKRFTLETAANKTVPNFQFFNDNHQRLNIVYNLIEKTFELCAFSENGVEFGTAANASTLGVTLWPKLYLHNEICFSNKFIIERSNTNLLIKQAIGDDVAIKITKNMAVSFPKTIDFSNLPKGTIASKPVNMQIGQPWLDTTDNLIDPVIRMTTVAT